MRWITKQAKMVCAHELGVVVLSNAQDLVRIDGSPVLIDGDPEYRGIFGCPNMGPTIKQCTCTLTATQGHSDFIRIGGRRVCLETITGLTNGTPPGAVKFGVRNPGQLFVKEGQST